MTGRKIALLLVCNLAWLFAPQTIGADIATTRHNLSITGPGEIKSNTEQEICVFCHTPHRARTEVGLLWNREDPTVTYTTYQSSSMHATVGQPTGASKLCLSCHDGTIALGSVVSRLVEIPFAGGVRFMPEGTTLIGTQLADDHPVSFVYDEALALSNQELRSPSQLVDDIVLDGSEMLQCTSCHDAHDDTFGNFLIRPTNFSELCLSCHNRTDWSSSSHATSTSTWSGTGIDPWPYAAHATVAENACQNCHKPHSAASPSRLLNFAFEEDNCLACHNGNVATTNIENQIDKFYRHPVQDFVGIHDPTEDFSNFASPHVECVDCHNPHRVNDGPELPPNVRGVERGVTGINSIGVPVDESIFSYEICFKCHADNNVLTFAPTTRVIPQLNTRLEFDITNPSYHPVESAGQNPNVPSLLTPYTVNSVIYCTDCHNSDDNPSTGGIGARGPHGSIYKSILERNYTTADNIEESSFEYALCYKCHNRDSILDDESFDEHDEHVRNEDAPCSACHDPHGISSNQGTPINNSHLINFDLNIVSPNSHGQLRFEDLGLFRGRCYLSCHGEDHNPKEYPD